MGRSIELLRIAFEKISQDNPLALRFSGILITLILTTSSGLFGWSLERLALSKVLTHQYIGAFLIIIFLASTIAARNLQDSVFKVLIALKKGSREDPLTPARKELSQIVGRDVWQLDKDEILRATAETASENSVDGVFAPLFWMLIGATLWKFSSALPGPLALSLIFKATSTIDSMIGYRFGNLKWLGTAGAKLDDLMTWLPCRIVMISLPLTSQRLTRTPTLIKAALIDGSQDSSPNSGISEAIFAYCAGVRMGGNSRYQNILIKKPILAKNEPKASFDSIKRIMEMSLRLELYWLIFFIIVAIIVSLI